MGKKLRQFLFVLFVFGVAAVGRGQFSSEYPPEPVMVEGSRTGCGEGDGGTTSPPPPVGLCLPINDYLIPLFMTGVALGAVSLFRIEKTQEINPSVRSAS